MKINSAKFIVSNTDYQKCPSDGKHEFAFIGRSNVGKSSLINALTGRKALAKVSGKPGKTQLINHFEINEEWYLVDLPGYGWAKVSKTSRSEFSQIITSYLLNRESLINTFVLVDIRLEPQQIDLDFIHWMGENGLPFTILFTKADKLTRNKVNQSMARWARLLSESWEELPDMLPTSSVNSQGREDVLEFIGRLAKSQF